MYAGTGDMYGREGDEGELHVWGGIVSARLQAWADALDTAPEAVMEAARREGIAPVTDTAEPKGREQEGRPTDPALRCVAFARSDAKRLRDAVDA